MKRIAVECAVFAFLLFVIPLFAMFGTPAATREEEPPASSPLDTQESEEDGFSILDTSTGEVVQVSRLEFLRGGTAAEVPPTYELESYVINSGNIISATANIHCRKNGADLFGLAVGDGPIDAAFLAIEQITGHHYELDDFQIQAVTEGREAMGSTLVKLRSNGKLYAGNGISTDIIGSSIMAYFNALNKISYEENHR